MANKDSKSILSYLKNLMIHIIKWKTQESKRGRSWKNTIKYSKKGILDIQSKKPSLNEGFLKKNWDKTFEKAKKEAEKEMGEESAVNKLN